MDAEFDRKYREARMTLKVMAGSSFINGKWTDRYSSLSREDRDTAERRWIANCRHPAYQAAAAADNPAFISLAASAVYAFRHGGGEDSKQWYLALNRAKRARRAS